MDSFSFLARLVEAIVWPGTILVIIWILRRPLSDLIPFLQRLKCKDLEIEFGRQIEDVREEIRAELPPPPREKALPPVTESVIVRLAGVSPRSAVLEAWRQLEDALNDVYERHKVELKDRRGESPFAALRSLQKARVIDPEKMAILQELRALRNSAAHAPDFALSTDSAIQYAEIAGRLIQYLKTL